MNHFVGTVLRSASVTPAMVRITLDLSAQGFVSTGRPDEYAELLFPHPGETEPVLPILLDGLEATPEGKVEAVERHYTIRRWDARTGEADIDMVVHDGGVGAAWAVAARPGDRVGITDPGGGIYRPAPEARWRLMIGDATTLPAMGRAAGELAPGERLHVVAVVTDAGEHQTWESAGEVTTDWIHEPRPDRIGAVLEAAVRAAPRPDGPGFTWVAGENVATRHARKFLRHELGLARHEYATLGYWRMHEEEWQARYARIGAAVEARIDEAHDRLSDEEEFVDEVERIYENAGL